MIGVEETISKPFVAQVMQDISDTMFEKMERAKRGGFEAVDLLITLDGNVSAFYELVYNISQQKHDQVFAGKIKTYGELLKFEQNSKTGSKKYSYLLQKIKTDDGENDYNIDTIFV